ncbi:single-stranded-DNA-specific exonuclease RecJ [Reyranella sp. CPCC 100927]|uniref:single-stranded-DNA-specific exonuclease RecJ n=1 Tax=Reyranella sp. CPCC 100927 TaxID=2599616 RepID=UPI0011B47F5D|nr:single-stranded-DNA-specific exonuclease RecJ [Reyranella sp. CPCC 100927]TWT12727.1 single-stranded-DNA-specific exonuclease RecJ [Reyranella sp. CPCC 100927]
MTLALAPLPPAIESAFLGVEQSLSGRRWRLRAGEEASAMAIAQRHGLPDVVARLLSARGVAPDAVDDFLAPTLRRFLPDPSHLKDMDIAVDRLVRAVRAGEKIAVFGDYDVDGATSSALLLRFFRAVGGNVQAYIPDRLKEGYGPNAAALLGLKAAGVAVAVTVDCGITAFEPLEAATQAGLDMIVIDHHKAEARLPRAVAVVDPNRQDEASPHTQMAAVGVAFLLVVGVNRALRAAGWYGTARPEPDLRLWLDLVALGTVCDVVPLTGVNRMLVRQGLKILDSRANAGIAALATLTRLAETPGTFHLGFLLGPRVNAGGRVGAADLGTRLLSTDDPQEAMGLAMRLDGYNAERRAIEAAVLDAAIVQIEALGAVPPAIVAVGEGWHPGVIGIVASRLVERFHRPVFVIGMDGDVGKGSGRSVRDVDLGAIVIAARQNGLLVNGGGHPAAAGLTIERSRLADWTRFFNDHVEARIGVSPPVRDLAVDGALGTQAATTDLVRTIEQVGPFGVGNPEPRFVLSHVRATWSRPVGEAHVRCTLAGSDGGRLQAIAFRAAGGPVGAALLDATSPTLHVAGILRVDRWNGSETVNLHVEDAAPARAIP